MHEEMALDLANEEKIMMAYPRCRMCKHYRQCEPQIVVFYGRKMM